VDRHCKDVKTCRKETNLSHLSALHYAAVIECACSSCGLSYKDTKIMAKSNIIEIGTVFSFKYFFYWENLSGILPKT
jgi:hypothetical protein